VEKEDNRRKNLSTGGEAVGLLPKKTASFEGSQSEEKTGARKQLRVLMAIASGDR